MCLISNKEKLNMGKMSFGELLSMMKAGKENLSTAVLTPVRRRMYNGNRYFRNIHAFCNSENSVLQVLGDNAQLIPVSLRLFKSAQSEAFANEGSPVSTLFHSNKIIVSNGSSVNYENVSSANHPVTDTIYAKYVMNAGVSYSINDELKTATLKFTLNESQFNGCPKSDILVDTINTRILDKMVVPNYSNWNPLDENAQSVLDGENVNCEYGIARMLTIKPTRVTIKGIVDQDGKNEYSASLIGGVCTDKVIASDGVFLIATQSLIRNKTYSDDIKANIAYETKTFINPWNQHHVESVAITVQLDDKLNG